MPNTETVGATEPLRVSILTQGPNLIVSIHTALDDSQMVRLQRDLIDQVGRQRSRGIIVDLSTLDVLDSFAARTLAQLAHAAQLRGAVTVIVGISPEIAIAMTHLSLQLNFLHTSLDLEEGLALLGELAAASQHGASTDRGDGDH